MPCPSCQLVIQPVSEAFLKIRTKTSGIDQIIIVFAEGNTDLGIFSGSERHINKKADLLGLSHDLLTAARKNKLPAVLRIE